MTGNWLRASLALHRLAERVEANHVASARKRAGLGSRSETLGRHPPIRTHQIQQGVIMTTESDAQRCFNGWAMYLQAGEEARRRGDRRTGTDHLLLALLDNPSIEAVLGVSLQQARQVLRRSIRKPWPLSAWGPTPTLPHYRCAPCQRNRGFRDIAQKDRLRMDTRGKRKCLSKRLRPTVGGSTHGPAGAGPDPHSPTHQILRRCCWRPWREERRSSGPIE